VPFSADDVFVPMALAAGITPEIAASPTFLHKWQANTGISVSRSETDFETTMPTEADQELLEVKSDVPLLVTRELMLEADGRPLLLFVSRVRGDRCRISATVEHR
jgi:DNA-binding GntR family transcriptional regulator